MNELTTLLSEKLSETLTTTNSTEAVALGGILGGALGALAGIIMMALIFSAIIYILSIIANWRVFTKAGQKGWKTLIPIYNAVILFRVAGISPWWILGYLAAVIPGVGGLVVLGITLYLNIMLAKAFGKGAGFTVGLILLNTIFTMILGFGSSEYQLNKQQPEVVDTNV